MNAQTNAVSKQELDARVAARLAQLFDERKTLLLHHRLLEEGLELIEEVHRNRGIEGHPRKGAMIVGDSRAGKSTLLNQYAERYPDDEFEGRNRRRVVKMVFPAGTTTGQVMADLLRGMGDPLPTYGDAAERKSRFKDYLLALGVEVLMFDEAQHLVEGRTDVGALEISRWLKTLLDLHKVAVVLTGPEPVRRMINLNPEVSNRFLAPLTLQAFGNTAKVPLKDLRFALKKVQEHFTAAKGVDLSTTIMAWRFSLAAEGLIGLIVDIVQRACEYSIKDHRDTITEDDLARAYDRYRGVDIEGGIGNPFTADLALIQQVCESGWKPSAAAKKGMNKRYKAKARTTTIGDVIKKRGAK